MKKIDLLDSIYLICEIKDDILKKSYNMEKLMYEMIEYVEIDFGFTIRQNRESLFIEQSNDFLITEPYQYVIHLKMLSFSQYIPVFLLKNDFKIKVALKNENSLKIKMLLCGTKLSLLEKDKFENFPNEYLTTIPTDVCKLKIDRNTEVHKCEIDKYSIAYVINKMYFFFAKRQNMYDCMDVKFKLDILINGVIYKTIDNLIGSIYKKDLKIKLPAVHVCLFCLTGDLPSGYLILSRDDKISFMIDVNVDDVDMYYWFDKYCVLGIRSDGCDMEHLTKLNQQPPGIFNIIDYEV